jgi:hypothetical protein
VGFGQGLGLLPKRETVAEGLDEIGAGSRSHVARSEVGEWSAADLAKQLRPPTRGTSPSHAHPPPPLREVCYSR